MKTTRAVDDVRKCIITCVARKLALAFKDDDGSCGPLAREQRISAVVVTDNVKTKKKTKHKKPA